MLVNTDVWSKLIILNRNYHIITNCVILQQLKFSEADEYVTGILHRLFVFAPSASGVPFLLLWAAFFLERSAAVSLYRPSISSHYGFVLTATGWAEIREPWIVIVQRNFDLNQQLFWLYLTLKWAFGLWVIIIKLQTAASSIDILREMKINCVRRYYRLSFK